MALKVDHVGQYGAHRTAKQAGFKKGDFIVEFGGRKDLFRETDWFAYSLNEFMPYKKVNTVVIRNEKPIRLQLTMKP